MVRQRLLLQQGDKSVLPSRRNGRKQGAHRFESHVTTFYGADPVTPNFATTTGLFRWHVSFATGHQALFLFVRPHMRSQCFLRGEGLAIAIRMETGWRMIIPNVALQFRPSREILDGPSRAPGNLCTTRLESAGISVTCRRMSSAKTHLASGVGAYSDGLWSGFGASGSSRMIWCNLRGHIEKASCLDCSAQRRNGLEPGGAWQTSPCSLGTHT